MGRRKLYVVRFERIVADRVTKQEFVTATSEDEAVKIAEDQDWGQWEFKDHAPDHDHEPYVANVEKVEG